MHNILERCQDLVMYKRGSLEDYNYDIEEESRQLRNVLHNWKNSKDDYDFAVKLLIQSALSYRWEDYE